MKTSEKNNSAVLSAAQRISLVAAVLMAFFVSTDAMAARERLVLDYGDSQIRGQKGQSATLYLKKTLKEQYPWVDIADLDLRRVVLIAKSKQGMGGAQLRVGNRMTEMYQVDGRPDRFRDDRRYTFDRVHFSNPSSDSSGPWQIELQGNFVVNKVVLEVDDQSRRHVGPPKRYRF